MVTIEKIQRTFWVKPKDWQKFQKQGIDLGLSSSERIEKFISEEIKYNNKRG